MAIRKIYYRNMENDRDNYQYSGITQHEGLHFVTRKGFASPVGNYREAPLNILRELIIHPAATYVVRVEKDVMPDAGIFLGDHIFVDRAAPVHNGSVALCVIDGVFRLCRLQLRSDGTYIGSPSDHTKDTGNSRKITDEDFTVWGVVVWVLHSVDGH